jgi:hypothetical protein
MRVIMITSWINMQQRRSGTNQLVSTSIGVSFMEFAISYTIRNRVIMLEICSLDLLFVVDSDMDVLSRVDSYISTLKMPW